MREAVWMTRVQIDFQSIYERMEDFSDGMGDRLYAEILNVLEVLKIFPEMCFQIHPTGLRRALVWNRRYGLIYRLESRAVMLHSVMDLREDPERHRRIIAEIAEGLRPIE